MSYDVYKLMLSVHKHKSISKAALEENISQPAVSQQIKSLESALNTSLFNRSSTGVTPTKTGELFLNYAQKIIKLEEQLQKEIQKELPKQLIIYSTPVVNMYALPCTLFNVSHEFPEVTVRLESIASELVEEKVVKGEADIGFISGTPTHASLDYKPMISDEFYLVSSMDYDVPDTLCIEELCNHILIMLGQQQRTRTHLDALLQPLLKDQYSLRIPYEMDSIESIKNSTMRGYGLSFLPYMAIKKELYQKQLRIIKLKGFDGSYQYSMIKRKDPYYSLSPIISYFEKKIEETIC